MHAEEQKSTAWALNGTTGAFLSAPANPPPHVIVDTFPADGAWARTSQEGHGTARHNLKTGAVTATGALKALDGKTMTRAAFYDELHGLGFLVIVTHSGGNYYLARGEMPPR